MLNSYNCIDIKYDYIYLKELCFLPEYMQKIWTDGKGEKMPMKNESMSVTDVMVIDTAASDNMIAILSGTGSFGEVRLQAASITNVSSIPIPVESSENYNRLVVCGYNNVISWF